MCENCNRKFKVPVEIDFRSIIDQLDTVKPANTVADSKTNKDDCVSSADASGSNGESVETNGVSSKATVNDIIRSVLPWVLENNEFSDEQKKTARILAACKTEKLGGVVNYCPKCHKYVGYQYCSCGNRCCPLCQYPQQKKWVELRKAEIIPGVPYYHAVQTLPHELNDLFLANRVVISNLAFRSFSTAIIKICDVPKVLGAKPGMIMVQHTWNSLMELHLHIHALVTGGGLAPDGKFVNLIVLRKAQKQARLDKAQPKDNVYSDAALQAAASSSVPEQTEEDNDLFFFSMKEETSLFRGIFMCGLRELYKNKKLVIPAAMEELSDPYEWAVFCNKLENLDWVGHINKTLGGDGSFDTIGHYVKKLPVEGVDLSFSTEELESDPDMMENSWDQVESNDSYGDAFDYLGRYIFQIATSNHRITDFDENSKTVTFQCRVNGKPGQKKTVSMSAFEFVRRFLMHIPPQGFTRVRFSGFLANACKAKNLANIFQQIGKIYTPSPLKNVRGSDLLEMLFPDAHYGKCTFCGTSLLVIPFAHFDLKKPRGKPTADK